MEDITITLRNEIARLDRSAEAVSNLGTPRSDNNDGRMAQLLENSLREIERVRGLLSDEQYIDMKARYARGELSWANMINEREAQTK